MIDYCKGNQQTMFLCFCSIILIIRDEKESLMDGVK